MRVSLVILSKRFGGAERHVLDLANQLTHRSIDVQVVVRQAGWLNEGVTRTLDARIQIVHIPPIFRRWNLQRTLHRFKPDIIHSHLGMTSRLVGRLRLNTPKVATLHGQFKAKDYMKHDALICVAPWQRATIASSYLGRVEVIPNFLPPCEETPEARALIRKRHDLGEDTFVVGCVGRFSKEKGFDNLIRAFLKTNIPNSCLLLVGDGPEMGTLETLASPKIIFAGWQENPCGYYRGFDVFASAARDEPFGLALLQAMQMGLPVISTLTNGPRWLIGENRGITVPINDIGALANAMSKLATDSMLRAGLGERALKYSNDFKPDNVMPKILALYQDSISRPAKITGLFKRK